MESGTSVKKNMIASPTANTITKTDTTFIFVCFFCVCEISHYPFHFLPRLIKAVYRQDYPINLYEKRNRNRKKCCRKCDTGLPMHLLPGLLLFIHWQRGDDKISQKFTSESRRVLDLVLSVWLQNHFRRNQLASRRWKQHSRKLGHCYNT